ncbi:iron only hydrogenase large subunit, C-terminal domain containing protein [Nitzschia inconspicua]|uniref:Iron only hydrogenase large subunit, C-terminal domain containing protein n=1 Tax=Nitzschia inconspicua TaxID=303405 RepID=A0A9K3PM97_9STRA|nr:iron only hydrogenase large subunit, C-terminal domain containing protein [Nitzschia inconspicua]
MPCHDKKLEASRKDFYLGDTKEQIVNLVISTKECVELVEEWLASKHNQENKVDISAFLESLPASGISTNILQPKDLFPTASQAVTSNAPLLIASKLQNFLQERNFHQPVTEKKQMTFASGGHADYIFHYAARKLFDCHLDESDEIWKATSLVTKMVKSARLKQQRKLHYYEAKLFQQPDGSYSCKESEDPPVLHFAIAHGMQTMQRALKSIQSSISDLHYLEAMACPHGCVNGGGSAGLRTDGKNSSSSTISVIRETPSETQSRVKDTLTHLHISAPVMPLPDEDLEAFRTRYHVVPPMQYTMGATAGVQVDKIQW